MLGLVIKDSTLPRPLHSRLDTYWYPGMDVSEQSSPLNSGSQAHRPREQVPLSLHNRPLKEGQMGVNRPE
jgi:hypothetical protein